MSFDREGLPKRIKMRLKELSMTQDALAEKMGVTLSAVAHYLGGRRVPPLKQISNMSNILKVSPIWLMCGVESADENSNMINRIPLVTWKQIAEKPDFKITSSKQIIEYIPYLYTDKSSHYALRIEGDAMTATSGYMPSFREGDVIMVDNAAKPELNDFVVVVLPDAKEAILRQLVTDGGTQFLKPLNQQYPLIDVNTQVQFCGVVVYRISKEQKNK